MTTPAPVGTPGSVGYVDPFAVKVPAPTYTGPVNDSINNTQQGTDLVNSNQQQAAKMGITIPGATDTPPASGTTTPTGTTPTSGTSDAQKQLTAAQAQRDQAAADYQAQAQKVSDTITNIQNGSTPLTIGEEAQISGLQTQFQTLIDAQKLQNVGAEGTAQVRGFQVGAAEYDPFFQAKTIGSIVSAGQAKVADLQTKEAAAVAQLTQSFHDNDVKAVQDAWGIYKDAYKARTDALQATIKDTQDAISAAQAEADKQQQYDLDVAKFNQTKDQSAFDNAFKIEQEKFNETNKTADDAETKRHNRATEAIAAFNAGMGGGGGGGITLSQSASMGAKGPDPASQKQVYDQITAQYGPMTAVAIKSLANYEMNPADWSTRTTKGGMTREQAVTLAKMYDPTYTDTNYAIRASYLKSIASTQTGTVGSAINAANKSINHLTTFATIANQMTQPGTAGQKNATTLAQANTAALGVSEELAKFFKGSGTVDVASIEAWKGQINPNGTRASVHGTVQGAIDLLGGQLETLTEQYTSTMGKEPQADFLGPSARASLSSLKNQGYVVDIPGINFTDVKAYTASDPNAAENMKSAYQALQAAGLPTTPDNILQMAQSL